MSVITFMFTIASIGGDLSASISYTQAFGIVVNLTRSKIAEGLPPRPDLQECAHLKRASRLLRQDKLGGDDGQFDHRDIAAVTDSVLQDPVVIRQMHLGISQTAEARAMTKRNGKKRWGPGALIAQCKKEVALHNNYDQYFEVAATTTRSQVESGIRKALAERGVKESPHRPPDKAQRTVTLAELEEFGEITEKHLQSYRAKVEAATGRKTKGTKGEIEWILSLHGERQVAKRF